MTRTSQESYPSLVWKNSKGRAMVPAFFTSGQFHVAGIVNVTPDSFSDGGSYFDTDLAVKQALQLLDNGADSIDFGAESTRPGSTEIGSAEEQKRLIPVLQKFKSELEARDLETIIAIDSFRADTAELVLENDLATVINDVSGGVLDDRMLGVLGEHKPGYVLGHCPVRPGKMQEDVHYDNVVEELYVFFEERLEACVKAGLPEDNIALDPCIGFAKYLEHNLAVMRGVERFKSLGRPLYFGISRKSFLKDFTLKSIEDKDNLTQIATAFLAMQGVPIHRVHNVSMAKRTLKLTRALMYE